VQLVAVGAVQTLLVLQVEGAVRLLPVQEAPAHWVPDGHFWQAPLPLQRPFVPQVDIAWAVHSVVGVGAAPPGTEVQVPTDPARLQTVQVPVQALLQQTLFTQKPEAQAFDIVQVAPIGSLPQVSGDPMQVDGAVQSVLTVQVVLQTLFVVSQAKGSHSVEVTVLQLPVPSQVRAGVSVSPLQLCATQVVPLV
jgi:hypothetical protein